MTTTLPRAAADARGHRIQDQSTHQLMSYLIELLGKVFVVDGFVDRGTVRTTRKTILYPCPGIAHGWGSSSFCHRLLGGSLP